jgi:hypothetical protein
MAILVAVICRRRKCSPVISDCERRANFHSALRSGGFFRRFGLFEKMNGGFVAVVSDEVRRFLKTHPTQCTAGIHIPLSGHVLGLFAQFVRHISSKLRMTLQKISSGLDP